MQLPFKSSLYRHADGRYTLRISRTGEDGYATWITVFRRIKPEFLEAELKREIKTYGI